MIDFPLKSNIDVNFKYERSRNEIILDCKVFPQQINKTEPMGIIRKHKFFIKCDGNKGFYIIEELLSFEEKIKKLNKLKESKLINEEQYNNAVNKILEKL